MGTNPTPQLQNMLQLLQKNEEEYKLIEKIANWIIENESLVEFCLWAIFAGCIAKALFFEIVKKDREGLQ